MLQEAIAHVREEPGGDWVEHRLVDHLKNVGPFLVGHVATDLSAETVQERENER